MRGQQVEVEVPTGGARSNVLPHKLQPNEVPADPTRNVLIRRGKLVNRPGYEQITSNATPGRPMGGVLFRFNVGFKTVIGTTTGWYVLNPAVTPNTWTDITGGVALTGNPDRHSRFTVYADSAQRILIGVNGANGNTPKVWDGAAAAYSDLGGGAPPADDIASAANRVLLANPLEGGDEMVYRVRFSEFNNPNVYPADNFADLSDTPDQMVGIRALSRVACAIYKAESQWIAVTQAGLFPFKFEMQDLKPGPVSTAAIVVAQGRHFYLGRDANIYTFDGLRATPVGEGIREWIARNMNFDKAHRAFGLYQRRDRNVLWVFPPVGSEDPLMGLTMNVDTGAFFPQELSHNMSCGFQWDSQATVFWDSLGAFTWDNIALTYPTWDSFGSVSIPIEMLGQINGIIHRFGFEATDNGLRPRARWRFGPSAFAGAGFRSRPQAYDMFCDLTQGDQYFQTKIGFTDTIAQDPYFPADGVRTFNMADDEVKQASYEHLQMGIGTLNAEAKYIALEHDIEVSEDFAWSGGVYSHMKQAVE